MLRTVCGLDIGTTRCKAVVVDENGNLISFASSEYAVLMPEPGYAEQDVADVWEAVISCLAKVVDTIPRGFTAPEAIGLSVQGEAVIPISSDGTPLRNAILGMDTRTHKENELIKRRFGEKWIYKHTGQPIHTVNSLPKILWIKRNEYDIWRKTHKFMLYEDYIGFMLTHNWTTSISHCLASRTQLYDLHQASWSEAILRWLNTKPERFSEPKPTGHVVGYVRDEIARKVGIDNKPLVVLGGHDQACAALGAAIVNPGDVLISTGTAEVLLLVSDKPVLDMRLAKANISCYFHVLPNLYLNMALNHCGGITLQWLRNIIAPDMPYEAMLADLPANPTGLLFYPYLSGSGSPWPTTSAKGMIWGLTFSTHKKDLTKALLEGLCLELKANIELLSNVGLPVKKPVRVVGGGAKSLEWNQLKANILNLPVQILQYTDTAPLGAAIIAGKATGMFNSITDISARVNNVMQTLHPNAEIVQKYLEYWNLYKQIRRAIYGSPRSAKKL
jgi:xylulokinase